jgi:hypothetical protein
MSAFVQHAAEIITTARDVARGNPTIKPSSETR